MKQKGKLLKALLSFVAVPCMMLFFMCMTVLADDPGSKEPRKYNLWVGNVQVDDSNKDHITCGEGYAYYDSDTYTLTFDNADNVGGLHEGSLIYTEIPLTIEGYATFEAWSEENKIIYAKADLNIQGNITLIGGKYGIYSDEKGKVTISGTRTSLTIKDSGSMGICARKGIAIKGGKLDVDNVNTGLYTDRGDIEIEGGNLNINSNKQALDAHSDHKIVLASDMNVKTPEKYLLMQMTIGGQKTYSIFDDNDGSIAKKVIMEPYPLYKVSFNMNGKKGSELADEEVKRGKTVSKPMDPIAADESEFLGWYLEPECTNPYDFSTPVTSDLVLYAKWAESTEPKGDQGEYTIDLSTGSATLTGKLANRVMVSIMCGINDGNAKQIGIASPSEGFVLDYNLDGLGDLRLIETDISDPAKAVLQLKVMETNAINGKIVSELSDSSKSKLEAEGYVYYGKVILVFPSSVTSYAVTVNGGTGSGTYAEGESVTITAGAPATGKVFDKWESTGTLTFTAGSAKTATATFSMPANDVTVTATYKDIASQGQPGQEQQGQTPPAGSESKPANVETPEVAEQQAEKIDETLKNSKITKLTAGKNTITASWKKIKDKNIKGYEIQYSTDRKFKKDVKTITIKKIKTTSKKIKKLKAKKYYVRIRTFKNSGSDKVYSKWSSAKNVKVK